MNHRIGIVVFDGVTLLDASGPADVFRLADPSHSHYELLFISPGGGSVVASSGITMADTHRASDVAPLDTVLVAGGDRLTAGECDLDLLSAVSVLAEHPGRVASVCTRAFVLAELGYLDDRRATTHWRHAEKLSRRYPKILVEPDVIHIRDGRYLTSAGITAGIDLALAIVEDDLGSDGARGVARELVMFMQRPGGQTQFSTALRQAPAQDERLRQLMDTVAADPAAPQSVASMAAAIGVSPRQLSRLFRAELGTTPAQWVEEIRIDAARSLLLEGHPVTRAARLSGFGTDETLRRAFARRLGATPTEFRDRFATTRRPHPRTT